MRVDRSKRVPSRRDQTRAADSDGGQHCSRRGREATYRRCLVSGGNGDDGMRVSQDGARCSCEVQRHERSERRSASERTGQRLQRRLLLDAGGRRQEAGQDGQTGGAERAAAAALAEERGYL